jgi:hypothetical protein
MFYTVGHRLIIIKKICEKYILLKKYIILTCYLSLVMIFQADECVILLLDSIKDLVYDKLL